MRSLLIVVSLVAMGAVTAFKVHETFPPIHLVNDGNRAALASWYSDHPYIPQTTTGLSERSKEMLRWTASEFITARKAGLVSCEEYASVLVARMLFFKDAQQFLATSYDLAPVLVIEEARKMDARVEKEGIDSIAPLFCLPVPMKGTMATTDYPSSAGNAMLNNAAGKNDAAFTTLFRNANAIAFGKTNVPDFAASWVTMNPLNGRTMNLYNGRLTSGGSSGGSGSAVSGHVAPVAVTEDTGGSTRHPAFMNQNFGYDPTRNHYPNQGNPGITYTNDQVGLNSRSFADILLVDAAVLRTFDEHAIGKAAIDRASAADIRIGLPKFPFVDLDLPKDAYNFWGLKNGPVSSNLHAKYTLATKVLEDSGFTMVTEEWPEVPSKWFGRKVNAVLETLWSNRRINNLDYDGLGAPHLHSFTGQVAEWVLSYTDSKASLDDIWESSYDGGDGHSPRGFYGFSAVTDESQMRAVGHVQAEKLRAWNSYFDAHNVDIIMTPGQRCDAMTYEGMSNSSIPLPVRQEDGTVVDEDSSLIGCNFLAYFAFKDIPIPEVMVPTGLDAEGRPTAVEFWGRGVPEDRLFDDEYAKTHDIAFLHTVNRLVEAMHREPSLQRKDPPTVADSLRAGNAEL